MKICARHVALALTLAASACALPEKAILFSSAIDGVPGIVHLGDLEPFEVTVLDDVADNVIYHEVGPTGSTQIGGVTFSFVGDGRDMCVWVDPELVSWSQSISISSPNEAYRFPDNLFDDGDLDLSGGLSVYYSGVPGDSVGGFKVDYQDALGNVVPIDLVECFIPSTVLGDSTPSHAGRGLPEFCTIANTIEGVDYTVLMETYSVPIDDDRLSYGLILVNGTCDELLTATSIGTPSDAEECMILGESVEPGSATGERAAAAGLPAPSWIGSEVPSWSGSVSFEEAFCQQQLESFCQEENRRVVRGEVDCGWEDPPGVDGKDRCFCGDLNDTPSGGAF